MNLNDLLRGKDIDTQHVLLLRHRPWEAQLNKVLPWLAAERPELFNAYQQTQGEKVEQAMTRARYVAALIGHEPGKALFVGLYSVRGSKRITRKQFWEIHAYVQLRKLGMNGFTKEDPRSSILRFNLALTDFYSDWKGKLIVTWPGLERSWWRWADRNELPVIAILEESILDAAMPEWDAIELTWEQLAVLTNRWKSKLKEWRGIYYIFDTSDGKGYVGSACGESNLYGRWINYSARGHGGNRLLRQRDPRNFRFSILQRVSPDMDVRDVVRLETCWKQRVHTRKPYGLNDN